MRDNLVYGKKSFLDKIFEKVELNEFFTLRGNGIIINYEVQDRINKMVGGPIKIIPGGLFGGKKELWDTLVPMFENYVDTIIEEDKRPFPEELFMTLQVVGVMDSAVVTPAL